MNMLLQALLSITIGAHVCVRACKYVCMYSTYNGCYWLVHQSCMISTVKFPHTSMEVPRDFFASPYWFENDTIRPIKERRRNSFQLLYFCKGTWRWDMYVLISLKVQVIDARGMCVCVNVYTNLGLRAYAHASMHTCADENVQFPTCFTLHILLIYAYKYMCMHMVTHQLNDSARLLVDSSHDEKPQLCCYQTGGTGACSLHAKVVQPVMPAFGPLLRM